MRGRWAGARVAIWGTLVLVGTGLPAGAAMSRAACPPEEQAVLAAYADCAAFQRESGEVKAARKLETHAARLLDACDTRTSVFIRVDPAQELTECAEALAKAGRLDDARRIEPAAHAYRTEQMLRLVMHGGQVLDPARYMGRPADYERRRPGMNPPEQRVTTPEFSVGRPRGGGWRLTSGDRMPIFFVKDPSWMSRPPVQGQSIIVGVALRDPAGLTASGAAGFAAAFERWMRDTMTGRFSLASIEVRHRGDPGEYCADFRFGLEERDNPAFPGVTLVATNRGFACLEPAGRFMFEAFYSERRPQDAPSVLDEVIRGEAEGFLADIEVSARRDPPSAAPE